MQFNRLAPLTGLATLFAPRTLGGLDPRNRLHAGRSLADETRHIRVEAARLSFARAGEELLKNERVAAERPEAQVNIAALFAAPGDTAGADGLPGRSGPRCDASRHAGEPLGFRGAPRGRHGAAEAALRRAIAAHPREAEAQFALALALARQDCAGDALGPLEQATSNHK